MYAKFILITNQIFLMEILSIRVLNFSLASSLSVLGVIYQAKFDCHQLECWKVSYPDSMNQGQGLANNGECDGKCVHPATLPIGMIFWRSSNDMH